MFEFDYDALIFVPRRPEFGDPANAFYPQLHQHMTGHVSQPPRISPMRGNDSRFTPISQPKFPDRATQIPNIPRRTLWR